MSLSVGDALRDGLGRTFERNGVQLIAVFVAVRLASAVATNTLNRASLALAQELGAVPGDAGSGLFPGLVDAPTPFALSLGVAGAFVLAVAVAVLAEAVRIVAVRTMVSDRVDAVPAAYARRNIVVATVNGFVGGLVVIVLVVIGLAFFVVPGVFLAVSFLFVRQEIAVRDVNFVDAMAGSWALASGTRLALFGLAVALGIAGLLAALPGIAVGAVSPAAGILVGAPVQAAFVVFAVASISRAYVQLSDEGEADANDGDAAEADDEPDYEGALTADDLPGPDTDVKG